MTIAEKLSRAKDDIDAVYEAGYGKGYADGGGGNNSGGSAIDEEVNTQAELIAEIKKTAESLPDVGSGGGSSGDFDYIAYWDEMLGDKYTIVQTDESSLTPTCTFVREYNSKRCYIVPEGCYGADYYMNDVYDLLVIPRSIIDIVELAFDNAMFCTVVCLAATPPTLGWQGYWSADGGSSPPTAIYVPDGSVDAYKEDTTWAEFADAVRPLSEFNYSEV